MQLPKKYVPMIIAGVLGLVAVFLINMYIQQAAQGARQRELERQKRLSTVVVAKRDIPSGSALEENMLREVTIRRDLLQPSAATSIYRVVNMITLAPISKDEQILLNKVSVSGSEISLSSKVPKDKRALTIPVDNISSVGGMIRPGDHVDIFGVVPIPVTTVQGKQATQLSNIALFQDILVLAVGSEYAAMPGAEKEQRKTSPTVTLALSPEEANIVAFVQEQGKIRLSLRSPQDVKKTNPMPVNWDTVLRTVMPDYFREKPVEPPKPKKTVEIIRGQSREVKELE